MSHSRPGAADYALLILLSAIWGSSFIVIKVAVETVPAATSTVIRLAVATLTMVVIARLAGQSLPTGRRTWGLIVLASLFGYGLPFTLISWGEEVIDSGLAAILMAVMPLTTVLLAHLFTPDEKMTPYKAIGVALGIAGLVVLIGPEKLLSLGGDVFRQLAVAAAAACYGINAIITRSLIHLPRRALVATLLLVSLITLLPIALYIDRPWTLSPSSASMWAMLLLGFLHTALATIIMFSIIGRQGASFFSQINFLIPLFGVIWGVVVLSENPPPNAYLALVLILIGIAIARRSMGTSRSKRPEQQGPTT